MTVSIVIPVYNQERFLARAIESALNQSWSDCEVIVVDDGCTDGSPAIMARYAGIRIIRQANRGLAAARNAGLATSRGEIVIFLDADDRLWPDAARTGVELLGTHPEAMMVFGHCRLVDEEGMPLPTNLRSVEAHSYDELLRDNPIWTPAMVAFRRQVFDTVGGFDEAISPAADYDIYLRISRRFPLASHSAVTVDYRQHDGNMSRDPVLMLDATLAVLRAHQPQGLGDPQRVLAHAEAVRRWRYCYGERLINRFRTALRDRAWRTVAVSAFHLLRLYPAGVRHHLLKKARLMAGRGPVDDAATSRTGDGSPDLSDLSRP
jgi:glycosyltransferase involved in cell wall biosynthesis